MISPKIGDQAHFMTDDEGCIPSIIIDTGGIYIVGYRSVETGQVAMEERTWTDRVVRLNVAGTTHEGVHYYWDEDTWVPQSWHWPVDCDPS